MSSPQFYIPDFTIIVDSREQAPFGFRNMKTSKSKGEKTILVSTETTGLKTGDYSIKGYEDKFSIERKSVPDFLSCVGSDRTRFEAQLSRLNELDFSAVIIEGDWFTILKGTDRCDIHPNTVKASVVAWSMKYFPNVHWFPASGRNMAEHTTYEYIAYYHRWQMELQKEIACNK